MPTLDELLRGMAGADPSGGGAATGNNPEIEQMLGRITQLQSPTKAPGGGMPPAPQGPSGTPMTQGTPAAPQQAGSAPGMAPEQANVTYQMLVKAGIPPEIAKQAIAEPKFLQEILVELQKRQQGGLGVPPQAQAPMAGPGGPQRLAPPMA